MSIFSSTKMLLASLAVISSFAILSGCAMPAPAAMVTPFNVNEHSSYAGAGTSTITGSAFSVTKGGDVKIPAGNTLYLIPLTTYSKEALQKYYYFQLGGTQAAELKPYIRKTQIDAAGNFSFSNIPSGTYKLITDHTWKVGSNTTGGDIQATATVKPNETVKVIVQ